ncbi:MAG: hypothetical protein IJ299_00975, partial [Oscillospiraceae bacterium]|nr:hypothetical protein [Oscillospiraceae bacterium]
ILNGAILSVMSLTTYGAYFDIASCLIWTGVNLLTVFLMFSVSSVAAFLTGNSFALVAINGLFHCIAIIIAGSFTTLSNVFLYGYYETNALINLTTEWNFVGYIIGLANRFSYHSDIILPFDFKKLIIMLILACVLYAAAFLLYKKRRMETAEDVAAYKVLNPIFKYLLTFASAIGTFGIFSYTLENGAVVALVYPVIVSAVVYFAAEMILKKSLKIWKSYKGYLVFLVAFAVMVSTFAFTGFFGFETRVPDIEDIDSATVYTSHAYKNEPYMQSDEVIDYTIKTHSALVEKENIYMLRLWPTDRTEYLYISYKLKNGKTIHRRYPVTEAYFCEVLDDLYEMDGYREATLELFSDTVGRVMEISVMHGDSDLTGKEAEELLACLKADMLSLSYTEMRGHNAWDFHLWVNYLQPEEEYDELRGMHQTNVQINANYIRTVAYLKNAGLLKKTFNAADYDLTVLTAEQWRSIDSGKAIDMNPNSADVRLYEAAGEVTVESIKARTFDEIPGAVRITDAGKKAQLREFVQTTPVRYVPGKEYEYYVCTIEPENNMVSIAAAFYNDVTFP